MCFLRIVLVGAILAIAPLTAAAIRTFIRVDCSSGSGLATLTASNPTAAFNLTCPHFDSSLGTLFAVGLYIPRHGGVGAPSRITWNNNSSMELVGGGPYGGPSVDVQIIFGPVLGNLSLPYGWGSSCFPRGLQPGETRESVCAPYVGQLGENFRKSPNNPSEDDDFSAFIGSGNYVIPVTISSTINSGRIPGASISEYSVQYGVQNSAIEYYYYQQDPVSDVPEPATFFLAAIALGGLGIRRVSVQ